MPSDLTVAVRPRRSPARAVLATWAACCVVYYVWAPSRGAEFFYTVLALAAPALMFLGLRRRGLGQARWATLIVAGTALSASADAAWFVMSQRGMDPFPSVADAGYTGGVLVFAAGAIALVRKRNSARTRAATVDAAIVSTILSATLICTLLLPTASDPDLGSTERIFAVLYPVLDIVVLAALCHLVLVDRARNRASLLIAIGMACWFVGDVGWGFTELRGTYEVGGILDALYLAAYGFYVAGFSHDSNDLLDRPRDHEPPVPSIRMSMLVATAIAGPALIVAMVTGGLAVDVTATAAVATFIVVSLVMIRLWDGFVTDSALNERRQARWYASIAEHAGDFAVVLDHTLSVTWASPSVSSALGLEPDELVGLRPIEDLLDEAPRSELAEQLRRLLVAGPGQVEKAEYRVDLRGGDHRLYELAGTNLLGDGVVDGLLLVAHDISDERALREELVRRAVHDPLTGLPNRVLFEDRLRQEISSLSRPAAPAIAVAMLDLDDFKAVNDTFGHEAGDQLLKLVAARLAAFIRPGDTVARFGGDEFAILLRDVDGDVTEIISRLLMSLHLPMVVGPVQLVTRATAGIRHVRAQDGPSHVLRDADIALYAGKAARKGTVSVFEPPMLEDVTAQIEMRVALQEAWKRGEMYVVYQPIIDLDSGRALGVEALARWTRPDVGEVSPAVFIPVAEASGVVKDLGAWVLDTACEEFARLRTSVPDSDDLYLTVNVSALQLRDQAFPAAMTATAARHGIGSSQLVAELTESVLSDDDALHSMLALREAGVRIAVDDFGTGYSSLAYLQELPVDIVKVDRTFVQALETTPIEASVVKGVVALARSLELAVVAEGIEHDAQRDDLLSVGCSIGQGFGLARPQRIDQLRTWLSDLLQPSL